MLVPNTNMLLNKRENESESDCISYSTGSVVWTVLWDLVWNLWCNHEWRVGSVDLKCGTALSLRPGMIKILPQNHEWEIERKLKDWSPTRKVMGHIWNQHKNELCFPAHLAEKMSTLFFHIKIISNYYNFSFVYCFTHYESLFLFSYLTVHTVETPPSLLT